MKTQTTTANESATWDALYKATGNAYGAAGIMGNLYAESALIANNLQNSYNTKLGYTDKSYTDAVDNGSYANFSTDSAGYGLAQWTYKTRKKALLEYAQKAGASVGNLETQIDFLVQEMKSDYASTWKTVCNATSVKEASNAVLLQYEKPADTSTSVQTKRAGYGETYYNKYAASSTTASSTTASSTTSKTVVAQSFDKSLTGKYKVTTNGGNLNIRDGASTTANVIGKVANGATVQNYGYYTLASGVKWLLIQTTGGTVGLCSSQWLKKIS